MAPAQRVVANRAPRGVFVAGMPRARHTKTRTIRLADGGQFRVGPGTVSVPVSTVPLDPPAVVLHINRSCGCLELEPDANGVVGQPVRVDADRVLAIVEAINAERATDAMRGKRAVPPVELPPKFRTTARHVRAWKQNALPFMGHEEAAGYPSKNPDTPGHTLWVKRATGKAMLEVVQPRGAGGVQPVEWRELSARAAMQWLTANGYTAIPATLARRNRTGGDDEPPPPPPKRRTAGR